MLPILISEAVPVTTIFKILGIKFIIGIIAGFLIDGIIRLRKKDTTYDEKIIDLCEKEQCHCDKSIFKSSVKHTLNIFAFIFIVTLVINIFIYFIGENNLEALLSNQSVFGPLIAGVIGLIPNCAASVILTQLYLDNILSFASLMSGLLVGAGVGLAILFKMNKGLKENLKIVALLYAIGVFTGFIIELIGVM
jgi:hypothetical protein